MPLIGNMCLQMRLHVSQTAVRATCVDSWWTCANLSRLVPRKYPFGQLVLKMSRFGGLVVERRCAPIYWTVFPPYASSQRLPPREAVDAASEPKSYQSLGANMFNFGRVTGSLQSTLT